MTANVSLGGGVNGYYSANGTYGDSIRLKLAGSF